MTTRFLSTIFKLAASVTLGASLISSGSAQAAIFDFNVVWDDNTTTEGWVEFDDAKLRQYSYDDSIYGYDYHQFENKNFSYDYRFWVGSDSLLDADFTHEGTRYDESNLSDFYFQNSIYPEKGYGETGYYRPFYGKSVNGLFLTFDNLNVNIMDYGVDGSTHSVPDWGGKSIFGPDNPEGLEKTPIFARSLSVVERSAKATPEPTTMAGLALVGLGMAVTRRKQTKASVEV